MRRFVIWPSDAAFRLFVVLARPANSEYLLSGSESRIAEAFYGSIPIVQTENPNDKFGSFGTIQTRFDFS